MRLDGAFGRPIAQRAAHEPGHLLDTPARAGDRLGQLVGRAQASGDGEHEPGRGRDLGHRGRQPLGLGRRDGAHEHDPVGVEEWRLEDGVLEARGRKPRTLEGFEAEVGDELTAPVGQRRARSLVDEEALLAVEQQRGDARLLALCRARSVARCPGHLAIVLTTAR